MSRLNGIIIVTGLIALFLAASTALAAPLAGSVISNQASATFTACLDDSCTQRSDTRQVTSNLVETTVQAVPSFSLESDQLKPAVSGETVAFPHSLTNTGNVADRYTLCVADTDARIEQWRVVADEDANGLADINGERFDDQSADANGCQSLPSREVAPGERLDLVIEAVASGNPDTTFNAFTFTASSQQGAASPQENQNQITLIEGPVFDVVQSISAPQSPSPGGPYSVTLKYLNTSVYTARELELYTQLTQAHQDLDGNLTNGAGMSYVPGSARWSLDANTALSDSPGSQTVAGQQIDYCAYDSSATGDCQDGVRAVVDSLPPGAEARLTFEVTIDGGIPAGHQLINSASYRYKNQDLSRQFGANGVVDGNDPAPPRFATNAVSLSIDDRAQAPGVVVNNANADSTSGLDDAQASGNRVDINAIAQGGTAAFEIYVWNTGDGTDRFDITLDSQNDRQGASLADPFPNNTVFTLYRRDGATPLTDSSGSGRLDTGPIPVPDSGGACPTRFVADTNANACAAVVVVKAQLPSDATGGPFEATAMARSHLAAEVTNAISLGLDSVSASGVDLTADAPLNGSAPGEGPGPEASAVSTQSLPPGGSAVFALYVNNTGSRDDSYQLTGSQSGAPFTPNDLPEGWRLDVLQDAGSGNCATLGQPLSATPPIPANQAGLVCARLSAPNDATGGATQDLYLRARSATTQAQDLIHLQASVTEGPAISLTPDQQGQVKPGNAVVYTHQLRNTGNQPLTNLRLAATTADPGWSLVVYEDSDGDGRLSAQDQRRQPGDDLATGGDQTLAAGEQQTVFVRAFAPAEAGMGTASRMTVTVTATAGSATLQAEATNLTSLSNTDVVILKTQAPDADCNGAPDSGSDFAFTAFQVSPGECVVYRLQATNQGVDTMFNVTLRDRTQSFTQYHPAAEQCANPGGDCTASINAPANGQSGDISVNAGDLAAGEQATLTFGLKVQ